MKKIIFIAGIILLAIAGKAQSITPYSPFDSTTFVYLIDSTKTNTQTWPKNKLVLSKNGVYPFKTLTITTDNGLFISAYDSLSVYVCAPTIDSCFKKYQKIIYK
jgi:hypothetical protein